jgi:hypothetical protein
MQLSLSSDSLDGNLTVLLPGICRINMAGLLHLKLIKVKDTSEDTAGMELIGRPVLGD